MRLVADLHVHSRYSRATSREADLEGYYRWARLKGVNVVGTGDFTHPAWLAEISDKLVERDGLFELKDPPREPALPGIEPADIPVRFILTVEISSIYKKRERTRKVHTIIGVPSVEAARRLSVRLAAIGNIASDGRPILGLDPKDLLAILLDTAPDGFFIPAHIWTPWFSLFGSKSGFDSIEECFEELTPHVFALETGLSSDPPMNWRWSALDRFRLVSNSDAHSPANLAREANLLDTELSWPGVTGALRTGNGFLGTFEFYPEEGKYHFDGHRKCGVCLDPAMTRRQGGGCPVCGAPLTIGVLHRVLELADRAQAREAGPNEGFRYLIPLPELLSELTGTGAGSRAVEALQRQVVRRFGSEYSFLFDAGIPDIEKNLGALAAEAVRRMREGRVDPRPGYDGEFGVIRVFEQSELARLRGQDELFASPPRRGGRQKREALEPGLRAPRTAPAPGPRDASLLDDDQRAVVDCPAARIIVSAGPGSGKTRLLAQWLARVVERGSAQPEQVLALTFTTRAAEEMRDRLSALLGDRSAGITAATFHSFAFSILRSRFPDLVTVYNASQRPVLLSLQDPANRPRARELAKRLEALYEGLEEPDGQARAVIAGYEAFLASMGGADISSLVTRLLDLLESEPDVLSDLRRRFTTVAVDELQDINGPQFRLLALFTGSAARILCIGDPDQAIYGFRGSDRRLFFRFRDEGGARSFSLARNYRSTGRIVRAADAVILPARSAHVPRLSAVREEGPAIRIFAAADAAAEGAWIAQAIRDVVGGVDSVSVDAARRRSPGSYSFADAAVLFRTRAVRDALLSSLLHAGLPCTFRDNTPLAHEEPFRFLVAALRLAANPADSVSRRELEERGSVPPLPAASGQAVEALVDEIVGALGIDSSVPETSLGLEVIRESARDHGTDLAGFLSRVGLLARESEGGRVVEKISLLTFHAAKGLEFPVVFLAGVQEGVVPMKDDPEEERRLFYVAMTRARDELFISYSGRPSPFLSDIPADCVEATRRAAQRRGGQLTLFG